MTGAESGVTWSWSHKPGATRGGSRPGLPGASQGLLTLISGLGPWSRASAGCHGDPGQSAPPRPWWW